MKRYRQFTSGLFLNRFIITSGLFLTSFSSANTRTALMPSDHSLALLGDSITTGGGAHPQIAFDFKRVWNILLGNVDIYETSAFDQKIADFLGQSHPMDLAPPKLMWPSPREFTGAGDWVARHLLQAISNQYFNTEQLSWGYLVGRKLGIQPQNIYMAAFNGARVADLPSQVDRLLSATGGTMPRQVMIFFTGNDLCRPRWQEITGSVDFGAQLERGIRYLLRYAKPHPLGTEIAVVSYMGLTQILTTPSIVNKQLTAFGEKTTCQELRLRGFRPIDLEKSLADSPPISVYLSNAVPPNPSLNCPTINNLQAFAYEEISPFTAFGKKDRDALIQKLVNTRVDKLIAELSTRIRSYQAVTAQVVRKLTTEVNSSKDKLKSWQFRYLQAASDTNLEGEDIAQDCFHLSDLGQLKIAKAIYRELSAPIKQSAQ